MQQQQDKCEGTSDYFDVSAYRYERYEGIQYGRGLGSGTEGKGFADRLCRAWGRFDVGFRKSSGHDRGLGSEERAV